MTKQQAIRLAVAESVLETLAECEGAPAGHLAAAVWAYIGPDDFQRLMAILQGKGLVAVQDHYVTITASGRAWVVESGKKTAEAIKARAAATIRRGEAGGAL